MKAHIFLSTVVLFAVMPGVLLHGRTSQKMTPVGIVTQVEVPEENMDLNYKSQRRSMWCWAATMSMIFSYHQHPVSQERIVRDLFSGMEPDLPASDYLIFIRDLNRTWVDDNGETFRVVIRGLFDAQHQIASLSNSQIITELAAGRPLLMCNAHHATVVTLLQYQGSSQNPQIVAGAVYDPLPSIGKRPFEPGEYGPELTFLAAVHVTNVPTSSYTLKNRTKPKIPKHAVNLELVNALIERFQVAGRSQFADLRGAPNPDEDNDNDFLMYQSLLELPGTTSYIYLTLGDPRATFSFEYEDKKVAETMFSDLQDEWRQRLAGWKLANSLSKDTKAFKRLKAARFSPPERNSDTSVTISLAKNLKTEAYEISVRFEGVTLPSAKSNN